MYKIVKKTTIATHFFFCEAKFDLFYEANKYDYQCVWQYCVYNMYNAP